MGYSIMKIRELTGLSKSTISDLENDKSSPTSETLQKIASALEVPVSSFFDEENIEEIKKERDYSLSIKEQEKLDDEAKKIIEELSMSFSKDKDYLSEEDYFAVENAIRTKLEAIKIKNKKKFTPKKYSQINDCIKNKKSNIQILIFYCSLESKYIFIPVHNIVIANDHTIADIPISRNPLPIPKLATRPKVNAVIGKNIKYTPNEIALILPKTYSLALMFFPSFISLFTTKQATVVYKYILKYYILYQISFSFQMKP